MTVLLPGGPKELSKWEFSLLQTVRYQVLDESKYNFRTFESSVSCSNFRFITGI